MLRAEDYIEMRGNAHRAKWLTLVIFLMPVGAAAFYVARASYLYGGGLLTVPEAMGFLIAAIFATLISLYKAYVKAPFVINFGRNESVDGGFGDAGGDCGGD